MLEAIRRNRKIWQKKVTWHSTLGDIKFSEQLYRNHRNKQVRMLHKLSIKPQGYSERLQRKVVYAGQAIGFDTAVISLKELSDLEIDKTAIRRISLQHGKEAGEYLNEVEVTDSQAEYIMSQTDGSIVPITSTDDSDLVTPSQDKRKNKKRIFKEIRLNYAENNRGKSYYSADFVYANDIKPFIYESLIKAGYNKGVFSKFTGWQPDF